MQTQDVALGWYEAAPLALDMEVFGFFIVCLDEARLALICLDCWGKHRASRLGSRI